MLTKTCNNPTPIPKGNQGIVLQPLKEKIDDAGNKHVELPNDLVSKEIMEYRLDSLRRYYKGTINQLSKYTAGVDTFFDEKVVKIYTDTGKNTKTIAFSDDYVTVSARDSAGKGRIDLKLQDTITYVDYTKKRFLRSDQRIVDISNKNPYVKITHGSSITLKQPKTIISIGPSIGYGWSVQGGKVTGAPMVGVTATLNLLPIKTK